MVAVVSHPDGLRAEMLPDALGPERLGDELARLRLLLPEQPVVGLHDGDADPEPSEGLPDLNPHGTAAQHDQGGGQGTRADRLAVGPVRRVLQPFDRRDGRGRSRRQHDPAASLEDPLARHFHLARAEDGRSTADEPSPLAGEPLDRGLSSQSSVASSRMRCATGRPVGSDRSVPGHAGDAPSLGQQVARADHHLGRNACPVGTFAADQLGLHAHHVQTRLDQGPGDRLPSDPHADRRLVATRSSPGRPAGVNAPLDGQTGIARAG
jgi:hypothetical protein